MNYEKTDRILAFAPSLTRHARLLTGSQDKAVDYVRRCLDLLATQPERLDGDDTRLELFRTFHSIWPPIGDLRVTVPVALAGRGAAGGGAMDDELDLRILLLAEVERFSPACIAGILSIDERAVAGSLGAMKQYAGSLKHEPALIIEDDALMAKYINEIAQELGLTVIQVAANVQDAVCAALDQKPSVILIDLQLRRGESGLLAARAILQRRRVPVIFVTSYSWMLETAGGLEPAFVVSKPFKAAMLKTKISLALKLYSDPARAADHHAMLLGMLRTLLDGEDLPARRRIS